MNKLYERSDTHSLIRASMHPCIHASILPVAIMVPGTNARSKAENEHTAVPAVARIATLQYTRLVGTALDLVFKYY